MRHKRKYLSCAEFSSNMARLIAAGEDIFAHPHVRRCKLHRALLDDLEAIAKAAREMFPEIEPPDTVWNGIQNAMAQGIHPDPIVSEPWRGCRVVFATQVIEAFNPQASPPAADGSLGKEKLSFALQISGARAFPRREGRR